MSMWIIAFPVDFSIRGEVPVLVAGLADSIGVRSFLKNFLTMPFGVLAADSIGDY